ncbi:hypothetical protein PCK1_001122 [Pneumocystis canis]|nr:hypothetical protein PCK1_001122 [Pneumocystis canis]
METIQKSSLDRCSYEVLPKNSSFMANMLAGAFAGIMEHTVMFPIDAIKTRLQIVNSTYSIHTTIAGASATIASDALMNPFDVIKQRMQVYGSEYTSSIACARLIFKKEGLYAFYISYPTTLTMTIPFAAMQFMIYESFLDILNPQHVYSPLSHIISGGVAGAAAAAITTPLDVVKTLLQTRGASSDNEIRNCKGLRGAIGIIYEKYGFEGFLRGIRPRIVTAIPSAAICWVSYEAGKEVWLQLSKNL